MEPATPSSTVKRNITSHTDHNPSKQQSMDDSCCRNSLSINSAKSDPCNVLGGPHQPSHWEEWIGLTRPTNRPPWCLLQPPHLLRSTLWFSELKLRTPVFAWEYWVLRTRRCFRVLVNTCPCFAIAEPKEKGAIAHTEMMWARPYASRT